MYIVLIVLLAATAALAAIGAVFVRMLIVRQDDLPTPETGARCSGLLAPTGEALWAHNIPYFKPFRALPFESAEIIARDGLRLHADVLRAAKVGGVTLICCHGYKSKPSYDFAAMYDMFRELDCNLIFPHMRAHGASEGRYIGFGALDRFDIPLWAKKAQELFPGSSVFLMGMSMGAASVMQSAPLAMPESVCGIIADCGFSSCREVFGNLVGKVYHLPAFPFISAFELVNRLCAGYGFSDGDSVRAMAQSRLPLLYICGDSDLYVPKAMAMRIFDACRADKQLLLVPGAGHAASFMCAESEYKALLRDFIDKHRKEDQQHD